MNNEEQLIRLCREKGLKITTAESCTGGLISATLVNVSGASEVLNSAVVTYSNGEKERLLGVSHSTLESFGAVSSETACEMALGAMEHFLADVSIVSTGIAGPTGGTPEKPVGLVYIGIGYRGRAYIKKNNFSGDRLSVRSQTVSEALRYAIEIITTAD